MCSNDAFTHFLWLFLTGTWADGIIASEATVKDMGWIDHCQTKIKPNGHCRATVLVSYPRTHVVNRCKSVTHFEMGYPLMKPVGTRSWNELQWLGLKTGHRDNIPDSGHFY